MPLLSSSCLHCNLMTCWELTNVLLPHTMHHKIHEGKVCIQLACQCIPGPGPVLAIMVGTQSIVAKWMDGETFQEAMV